MAAHLTIALTVELARSLKPGDIIESPYYMFWHPYVVESVIPHSNNELDELEAPVTVRVIHYGRRDMLEGISVLRENLILDFGENSTPPNFRLFQFPEADCRPDEEVVELAQQRVGEAAHNIINNNASYFALSCKLTEEGFNRHSAAIGRVRMYNPFW